MCADTSVLLLGPPVQALHLVCRDHRIGPSGKLIRRLAANSLRIDFDSRPILTASFHGHRYPPRCIP